MNKKQAGTQTEGVAQTSDRFPVLKPDQLDAAQQKTLAAILSGPRAGSSDPSAVNKVLTGGPFNAWLRSPDLGDRLQKVGEYIRYNSSIPLRLNELAILVTARFWTSQFEWYAHHAMAMNAGLDPKIAEELAQGLRPTGMKEEEAAVYDFCTQLHRDKNVDDATYARVVALFGEQGAMDLIGASGYYTVVSMTLNVARVPLPPGVPLPLKHLA